MMVMALLINQQQALISVGLTVLVTIYLYDACLVDTLEKSLRH